MIPPSVEPSAANDGVAEMINCFSHGPVCGAAAGRSWMATAMTSVNTVSSAPPFLPSQHGDPPVSSTFGRLGVHIYTGRNSGTAHRVVELQRVKRESHTSNKHRNRANPRQPRDPTQRLDRRGGKRDQGRDDDKDGGALRVSRHGIEGDGNG